MLSWAHVFTTLPLIGRHCVTPPSASLEHVEEESGLRVPAALWNATWNEYQLSPFQLQQSQLLVSVCKCHLYGRPLCFCLTFCAHWDIHLHATQHNFMCMTYLCIDISIYLATTKFIVAFKRTTAALIGHKFLFTNLHLQHISCIIMCIYFGLFTNPASLFWKP